MTAKDSDGCAARVAIVLVCVLGIAAVSFFRGQGGAPSGTGEGPAEGWNKGGTLHDKSALDWQTASRKDKLATCGEFFTTMWKNGSLKNDTASELKELNDAHPYAMEIVTELNTAFERRPDSQENRQFFQDQAVSAGVMSVMFKKGWLKGK
ncbi:MAG: hypothetical protein H8E37_10250 [Planctomycetes bacterium]|nr:hypothetical protein [Planctomycetota bacterium]